MTEQLVLVIAFWFLFIVLFSDNKYKPGAFIICVVSFLNIWAIDYGLFGGLSYVQGVELIMIGDGLIAVLLCSVFILDPTAWRQALLIAFAVLCHIMIVLALTNQTPSFFFTHYDELIITIGVLQMGASIDGFFNALRNLSIFILRRNDDLIHAHSRITTHQKSKGIT